MWKSVFLSVLPVLRRVRQLEKKLTITEGRLPPVREVLSRFSAKLSEARDFLLKASSTVQETQEKNRASLLKVRRNEVISHQRELLLILSSLLPKHFSFDAGIKIGSGPKMTSRSWIPALLRAKKAGSVRA